MKILQTLQSILNYILKYIKTNTLEVSQIEFSDGTVQDTAPTSAESANKLYDLKVLPQAIIEKGWLAICKQARIDLLKSQVPTLYQDIYDKFLNKSSETSELVNCLTMPMLYLNGYYYTFSSDKTSTTTNNINIYRDVTADMNNKVLHKSIASGNGNGGLCTLIKDDDYIYINDGYMFYVLDYDFNLIKNFWLPNYILQRLPLYNYLIHYEVENKKIYMAYQANENSALAVSVLDLSDLDNITVKNITNLTYSFIKGNFVRRGNIFYYSTQIGDNYGIYKVNLETEENSLVYNTSIDAHSSNNYRRQAFMILNDNNKIELFAKNYVCRETDFETFTNIELTNLPLGGYYIEFNYILLHNSTYYIFATDNYQATSNYLIISQDLITFTKSSATYGSARQKIYQRSYFFMEILVSDIWLFTGRSGSNYQNFFHTGFLSSITPITFTDTYTINGSQVLINYYKYDTFKICVPNDTNDANLQTVYEFLGYLPYWRIDLTNETVSPIMDSRLWSLMYVGDNYEDSTLPDGSFERSLIYSDITNLANQIIGQITTKPTRQDFSSFTDGDTTLDLSSLTSDTNDQIYIYKNGILLTITDDYTIENFTVTFVTALTASDKITVVIFK